MILRLEKKQITAFLCYCLLYIGSLKLISTKVENVVNILQIILMGIAGLYIVHYNIISSFRLNRFMVIMLLFFAAYFCSAIGTYTGTGKKEVLKSGLIDLIFIFLIYFLSQQIDHRDLIRISIKGNTILLLIYLLVNGVTIISYLASHLRMEDIDVNPIWIARFCGDLIISDIAYEYYYGAYTKNKYIRFGRYALAGVILIVTGSKGPILAGAVVLLYFFLTQKKYEWKRKTYFLLAVALILVLALVLSVYGFGRLESYFRISSMFSGQSGYRLDRYQFSFSRILQNPIRGYGIGSWGKYFNGTDMYDYPHNSLLEIWFEAGAVSLALFLILLGRLIRAARKSGSRSFHILTMLVLFYFINSLMSGGLLTGNKYVFLFATVASTAYDSDLLYGSPEDSLMYG